LDVLQNPGIQRDVDIVMCFLEVSRDCLLRFRRGRRLLEGGNREQIVDRGRLVFLLCEAVSLSEGSELVGADTLHETVEMFANSRNGSSPVARLQQNLERLVELRLGHFKMAFAQLSLPGLEMGHRQGNEDGNRVAAGEGGGGGRRRLLRSYLNRYRCECHEGEGQRDNHGRAESHDACAAGVA
jgi:hypothetical protein